MQHASTADCDEKQVAQDIHENEQIRANDKTGAVFIFSFLFQSNALAISIECATQEKKKVASEKCEWSSIKKVVQ